MTLRARSLTKTNAEITVTEQQQDGSAKIVFSNDAFSPPNTELTRHQIRNEQVCTLNLTFLEKFEESLRKNFNKSTYLENT